MTDMTESEIARVMEWARDVFARPSYFPIGCFNPARALLHLSDRVGELLKREAETIARYDAKLDAAESRAASLVSENRRLREALEDIGRHDLIGLTGPAKIVAEAMRNVARAVLQDTAQREGTAGE